MEKGDTVIFKYKEKILEGVYRGLGEDLHLADVKEDNYNGYSLYGFFQKDIISSTPHANIDMEYVFALRWIKIGAR